MSDGPGVRAMRQAVTSAGEGAGLHLGITDVWDALGHEPLEDALLVVEAGYRFPNTLTDGYLPDQQGPDPETVEPDDLVELATNAVTNLGGRVVRADPGTLDGEGIALLHGARPNP